MIHFCTYFDVHYLDRGIALYNSLKSHCDDFTLHILCLDKETLGVLTAMRLYNVHLVSLEELEAHEPELFNVKGTRTLIEYFFTCTPVFSWFLINHYEIDMITYLDSDLFFFSSPDPIYEEFGDNSVFITSHNFPTRLEERNIYGKYNVGLLIFRNDEVGRACLEWWKNRCLEWCYDRVEGDRFADQKYLDKFEHLFDRVIVSSKKGVGLAPWNVEQYELLISENPPGIYVDTDPLIFFHYQGCKKINRFIYKLGLSSFSTKISSTQKKTIYNPYVEAIRENSRRIQSIQDYELDIGGSIRFLKTNNAGKYPLKRIRETIIGLRTFVYSLYKSDLKIIF